MMMVPLMLLALGAVAAGFVFARLLHRPSTTRSSGRDRYSRASQPHHARDARDPRLGRLGAVHRDGGGLRALLPLLHRRAVAAGARPPRRSGRCTCSCSTSGTSTSCTTCIFVRPAIRLGRLLWKGGDGAIIDGTAPTASPPACLDHRQGRQVADRLRLPLRLRHADRRGALITWFMFAGGAVR